MNGNDEVKMGATIYIFVTEGNLLVFDFASWTCPEHRTDAGDKVSLAL